MMEGQTQIAVVQAAFAPGEVAHNLARMRTFVRTCKEKHPQARLVLFPELSTTGYELSP